MDEAWPERIAEAQTILTVLIEGKDRSRIRYGDEDDDWGADQQACHDCAVLKGQLHVPGCDVECCPVCRNQAADCDCEPTAKRKTRPFTSRELGIAAAIRQFTWKHVGFDPNGDAVFEVANASQLRLSYIGVGVRAPDLIGRAWLDISALAPGDSTLVMHDCYKEMIASQDEVEFFVADEPTPETRGEHWEFDRLKLR